jgi:lipopolysaccharide export system protein LptA
MQVRISRVRRWFGASAIVLLLLVAGMYFYARWRVSGALKKVPEKIGLEFSQTAEGFTVSKSEQGRTLFLVRASKAVQFKQGGRTELHNVTITLYGRDSSRFDQIYGADFEYDPKSGDVTAQGEVQIDLEANPEGILSPDQTPPKELKNPIHLRTSGLIFNQKTGNAYTKEKVEFETPQASGSAVGVNYVEKNSVLTLESRLEILLAGPNTAHITAVRGSVTRNLRQIVLEQPHMTRGEEKLESETATLFLGPENRLQRVVASGNVRADTLQSNSKGRSEMHARSGQAELEMVGERSVLRTAILSDDVQLESVGAQEAAGSAGRVVVDFSPRREVKKIHADNGVKLKQAHPSPASSATNSAANQQDIEITAPAMDFFIADGDHMDRAETSGSGRIALSQPGTNQQTVVTAGKFQAKFGERSQLTSLHGAPEAKIVTSTSGQPERVSSSDVLDVVFRQGGGIESITQDGNLSYLDGDRKAWAGHALYTPANMLLTITGSPRVVETGMTTTAKIMRLNRVTGDATAEGDVKSTYTQLKQQPNGALLASADPIHVTSHIMTAHRSPAVALYTGTARLWQNTNTVEAPSIQFSRNDRSVVASGDGSPVRTVIVEVDKTGKATPVSMTSSQLTYTDAERRVHLEGGVVAKGADVTLTSSQMDAFLVSRAQSSGNQSVGSSGELDRIVAQGSVIVQEPGRRAVGDKLVYVAADETFVLTGGPPSIFDAEHGKITGDSLTFYKRDDRVLVEGRGASPTVSTTRVAR